MTTADADSKEMISRLSKPIVLIGLMGAGKTTVGKRLAQAVGRRFVDSDAEIEHAAGCSIADIFAIHGEPIFRDLEQRVIKRLLEESDIVLATGGGAWMQEGVRDIIKQKAVSLWLKAELEVLVERVQKRTTRPLLESGDKRLILDKLMQDRYPIYAEADIMVESVKESHEAVVARTIKALADYQPHTDVA